MEINIFLEFGEMCRFKFKLLDDNSNKRNFGAYFFRKTTIVYTSCDMYVLGALSLAWVNELEPAAS